MSVVSSNTLFYESTQPYINNEAAFILSSRVFSIFGRDNTANTAL